MSEPDEATGAADTGESQRPVPNDDEGAAIAEEDPRAGSLDDVTVEQALDDELSPEVQQRAIDYFQSDRGREQTGLITELLAGIARPALDQLKGSLTAGTESVTGRTRRLMPDMFGGVLGDRFRDPEMKRLIDLTDLPIPPAGARADQMDRMAELMEQQLRQLEAASGVMRYTADQTRESNRLREIALEQAEVAGNRANGLGRTAIIVSIIFGLVSVGGIVVDRVWPVPTQVQEAPPGVAPPADDPRPSAPGSSTRSTVE